MKRVVLALLLVVTFSIPSYSKLPKEKLSTPTFEDSGNDRMVYKVDVNSTTATIQPYVINRLQDRVTTIQNPGAYNVAVGTWSGFNPTTGPHFLVPASTGSLTLAGNATYYMKCLQNNPTGYVNILKEFQNNSND